MEVDVAQRKPLDYASVTYAQSCMTLLPNSEHLQRLQDAVLRMNKIRMLAGELLSRHIHWCLDSNIPLPEFTQTWCRQLFKEVSTVDKPKKEVTDDPCLAETAHKMSSDLYFDKISRSGLTQMLSAEATALKTVIKDNIIRHFKKRILSYVWWTFYDRDAPKMGTEDFLQHKLAIMQIASDLYRQESALLTAPIEFHSWIEQYRQFFGLSSLLSKCSVEEALKKSPELFLPCMHLINKAFEGSGKATFALMPLTRKFRPGFVLLDTTTWQEVLKLPIIDTKKAKNRARTEERNREKADGKYVSQKEKNEEKKAQQKVAEEARRAEKRKREDELKALNETKEQKKKRIQEEKAIAEELKRQNRLKQQSKKESDACAKDDYFAGFLHIQVNSKKGFRFAHSIRTDGVSARLLFTKEIWSRKTVSVRRNVKCGLYTIDQIKQLSRLTEKDMEVIGIDPGMHDLIHAVGDDYLIDPSKRLKYSAAQRRYERGSTVYSKKMQAEKPEDIVAAEQEMSKYNSRSSDIERQTNYFKARRSHFDRFYGFYGDYLYRIRRWRSFKKDQKSIAILMNNLKAMSTKGKTTILAYGSWTKPAGFNPSGIPSCIGIGLRRRLAAEFVVVPTPEHYTSKTCSKCFSSCGPFHELEAMRRQQKKAQAKTPEEKKKASRLTIRSIRRCQNEKCGVVLHRDRNAASNIATNFKLLYKDGTPLKATTAIEDALDMLQCSVCA